MNARVVRFQPRNPLNQRPTDVVVLTKLRTLRRHSPLMHDAFVLVLDQLLTTASASPRRRTAATIAATAAALTNGYL